MPNANKHDPFIGRDILNGQFQILQKIGSGGMGSVYKAAQPAMNRMVAVKILHPKLTARKDLASRFRREARAMSHLTHPNTAKVFLYGELEDGSLYIVMEFLQGRNIAQAVKAEGPMSLERAVPILVQACGALEEAHRAGIIHRDMKPENIFLCEQGGLTDFAKVLDFGLAKVTEREMRPGSIILTQEGMVFGTPEFMSPEQAQGKPLTPASDLYSLAIILFEMLTGKLPFNAKNPMEFIQLQVSGKPASVFDLAPSGHTLPPLLGEFFRRALAKNSEDRFASGGEFAEALRAVAQGATTLPPGPGPDGVVVGPGGSVPAPGYDPMSGTKPPSVPAGPIGPRKQPLSLGLLIGVAVGCLVLGIVVTVLVMLAVLK